MEYKTIDNKTKEEVVKKSNNYNTLNKIYEKLKPIYNNFLEKAIHGCKLRW